MRSVYGIYLLLCWLIFIWITCQKRGMNQIWIQPVYSCCELVTAGTEAAAKTTVHHSRAAVPFSRTQLCGWRLIKHNMKVWEPIKVSFHLEIIQNDTIQISGLPLYVWTGVCTFTQRNRKSTFLVTLWPDPLFFPWSIFFFTLSVYDIRLCMFGLTGNLTGMSVKSAQNLFSAWWCCCCQW